MSFEVQFEDENLRSWLNSFYGKMKLASSGNRAFLGMISAVVFRDVINHFENEQGSDGKKWKSWSPSYREEMVKKGKQGNKILQDTGTLRQNFKPSKYKKTNEGFLWFNDARTKSGFPYAFAHNEGGKRLPKRDFMWLSGWAMDSIEEKTIQFLFDR